MGVLMAKRLALSLVVLATVPALEAQRPGGVEFGAFGALTSFTPRFDLRTGVGGGGRVGYLFRPAWELEIEFGAERVTNQGLAANPSLTLGGAHVMYNVGYDQPTWYLLGGYARPQFRGTPSGQFSDNAAVVGIGGRMFLLNRLAVRADFRTLYTFNSHLPPSRGAGHLAATAGLSYFTAGGPPPDSDHDEVSDARDKCPDTPFGATVDRRGCPSDSDGDGILNGLDRCPDTPPGVFVDAVGCPVDSDADGVFDGIDQCPSTPVGVPVDTRGCPKDADADGVDDTHDRCPGTPAGVSVDPVGCPRDTDQDGVSDGVDRCPDTPPATAVDASGCPLAKDSDGDGVDDSHDKCPNTPPGTAVDAVGCQVLFRNESEPLVLLGVNFETGRSRLTPTSYDALDQVAASLVAHPEVRVEIAGYTDNTGSAGLNTRLSAARALAVRSYLARKGVAPGRMTAKGYGPANPVASNATAEGRAENRRVELHQQP
jgi:outer membrane protein OmpA-like peptidoglycan-associated protein